jgi:L-amino acid N-acyltransferase YncA
VQGTFMNIRACEPEDVKSICEIYNYYVKNTTVTFEENTVDHSEMLKRLETYTKTYPWFVCEVDRNVVGYAYATKWKDRGAYKHSAELTIYLKNTNMGKGYGKALYAVLLDALYSMNCHLVLAGIALPNETSIKLHESFGFRKAAHFSEIGHKFDNWIDVGYWEKKNPNF